MARDSPARPSPTASHHRKRSDTTRYSHPPVPVLWYQKPPNRRLRIVGAQAGCVCTRSPTPPVLGCNIHANAYLAGRRRGSWRRWGGTAVSVGGRGSDVEVGAGIMVSAAVAAASCGLESAVGRITRIYARLPHSKQRGNCRHCDQHFAVQNVFHLYSGCFCNKLPGLWRHQDK